MPLQVDDVRLPTAVEANAQFMLTTETMITTSPNGIEQRFAKRRPRVEATISFGPEYAEAVMALYRSQIGPRYAFYARDHSDFLIEYQTLTPESDGTYVIMKTYGDGERTQVRRIVLPDVPTTVVLVDGSVANPNDYTIVDGVVIPGTGISYANQTVTIWTAFDIPVRFAEDQLNVTMPFDELTRVTTMRIIEVLWE